MISLTPCIAPAVPRKCDLDASMSFKDQYIKNHGGQVRAKTAIFLFFFPHGKKNNLFKAPKQPFSFFFHMEKKTHLF